MKCLLPLQLPPQSFNIVSLHCKFTVVQRETSRESEAQQGLPSSVGLYLSRACYVPNPNTAFFGQLTRHEYNATKFFSFIHPRLGFFLSCPLFWVDLFVAGYCHDWGGGVTVPGPYLHCLHDLFLGLEVPALSIKFCLWKIRPRAKLAPHLRNGKKT